MDRADHIRWCKKRAHEYLDKGDIQNAITSMLSDLSKHDETRNLGENMGALGMLYIMQHDTDGARRFIDGFAE